MTHQETLEKPEVDGSEPWFLSRAAAPSLGSGELTRSEQLIKEALAFLDLHGEKLSPRLQGAMGRYEGIRLSEASHPRDMAQVKTPKLWLLT